MKVIDLFCGAGGFSEGFMQEGFKVVCGLDNDQACCESFKKNFPEAKVINKDIMEISFKDLPKADVLIGSPPCNEWSSAKGWDKRTCEMKYILKFQKLAKSYKYWVWECAKETHVIKPSEILDSSCFEVPQIRKRAFHSNFKLPLSISNKMFTVNEALGWKENKVLYNYMSLNTGAGSPIYLSNRPARTVTTIGINVFKERSLTDNQLKIIMGINKDFIATKKQIGMAVCPPIAKAIAKELKKCSLGKQEVMEEGK